MRIFCVLQFCLLFSVKLDGYIPMLLKEVTIQRAVGGLLLIMVTNRVIMGQKMKLNLGLMTKLFDSLMHDTCWF